MGTDEVLPRHGARYNCRSILRRTSILDPQRESSQPDASSANASPSKRRPSHHIHIYTMAVRLSGGGEDGMGGERER